MGKKQENKSIENIKTLPVQAHIGSLKLFNDDWSVISFIMDRKEIQKKFADKELRYNCIYFLFGYENQVEKCYVGQAKKRNDGESVLKRLREHDESKTEPYRDIWEWAVVFTSKDDTWTIDDLNALEHIFYTEIPSKQNLNGNKPNSGGANFAKYTDKISYIKQYISAIGFTMFTQTEEDKEKAEALQVTSETNENSTVEDLQNGMARIPEIITPQKVVNQMIAMLPADVWNDKTVFLDPACKGGEFLKAIYDKLMDSELLISKYPDEKERTIHILKEQIYGIALSQVSLDRTSKKLFGYDGNLRVIPNYINYLKGKELGSKKDGSQFTLKEIINREFNKDMKFDVVIGNPPYQEVVSKSNNKNNSKPLYNKFIQLACEITDEYILITPNTYFTGSKYDNIRHLMIEKGIAEIVNFPVSGEVFNGVGTSACITHGVSRVQNTHVVQIENEKIVIDAVCKFNSRLPILFNDTEMSILGKFTGAVQNCESLVKNIKYFGIETNCNILSGQNKGTRLSMSMIDDDINNIKVLYKEKREIEYGYINIKDVPSGIFDVEAYKVICGNMASRGKQVISNIEIIKPNEIVTGSWGILGCTKTLDEALAISKYFKTRLCRLLISCEITSSITSIHPEICKFVPMQDFTVTSDIDWTQSINNIDLQLCKKYNLSDEEMEYIAKTINPII